MNKVTNIFGLLSLFAIFASVILNFIGIYVPNHIQVVGISGLMLIFAALYLIQFQIERKNIYLLVTFSLISLMLICSTAFYLLDLSIADLLLNITFVTVISLLFIAVIRNVTLSKDDVKRIKSSSLLVVLCFVSLLYITTTKKEKSDIDFIVRQERAMEILRDEIDKSNKEDYIPYVSSFAIQNINSPEVDSNLYFSINFTQTADELVEQIEMLKQDLSEYVCGVSTSSLYVLKNTGKDNLTDYNKNQEYLITNQKLMPLYASLESFKMNTNSVLVDSNDIMDIDMILNLEDGKGGYDLWVEEYFLSNSFASNMLVLTTFQINIRLVERKIIRTVMGNGITID